MGLGNDPIVIKTMAADLSRGDEIGRLIASVEVIDVLIENGGSYPTGKSLCAQ